MESKEIKLASREEQMIALQRRAFLAAIPKPDYSVFRPKLQPHQKKITDVPEDILTTIRVRMYAIGALVWDYVDSVLDMAKMLRRPETRKLSRAVRQLRDDYDRHRAKNHADRDYLEREMQWALDFEEYLRKPLREFVKGVKQEQEATYGEVEPEHGYLIMGVQQAMAMVDAIIHYTKGCDRAIARYGVPMGGKTICPPMFRKLATLLPEFAGDMWIAESESRKKAAEQIALELTKIVVCDKDGDLAQPKMQ